MKTYMNFVNGRYRLMDWDRPGPQPDLLFIYGLGRHAALGKN